MRKPKLPKVKHSKGPWKRRRYLGWKSRKEGNPVYFSYDGEIVSADDSTRIFRGPASFHALGGATAEECEANARLIEKSPELYDIVRKFAGTAPLTTRDHNKAMAIIAYISAPDEYDAEGKRKAK